MGLVRVLHPVADAITIHTAKKQCEIAMSDSTHDEHLHRLIVAATQKVEEDTRRALITQTWKLTKNCFPRREILVPKPPLVSVQEITYIDHIGEQQILDTSEYQVSSGSPAVICPKNGHSWPTTQCDSLDAVGITFTAGYGHGSHSVPSKFQNVIAELVAFYFANRGDVQSQIPEHISIAIKSLRCGAMYGLYEVRGI